MSVNVVIGANYGDEGKGMMVDTLCNSLAADGSVAVVRFNGGAQAGHTVVTPGFKYRHVFSHFGAGTLVGAPTILSRFFVANPVVFGVELKELQDAGYNPIVTMSENCMVTTPYDVFLTREMERQRGNERHGSCGMGFGETIQRYETTTVPTLKEMQTFTLAQFSDYFDHLANDYVPQRLRSLGFVFDSNVQARLLYEQQRHKYLVRLDHMMHHSCVELVGDSEILSGYDHLVFEGAQGLLLDMTYGQMPHVTRSNTGMENVLTIMEETGCNSEEVLIWYMTRAYLTRHGAGPLPNEGPLMNVKVDDPTNIPNDWQGSLRFAPLDCNLLMERTARDFAMVPFEAEHNLVVTCCDQFPSYSAVVEAIRPILESNQYDVIAGSYGPTRDTLYHE